MADETLVDVERAMLRNEPVRRSVPMVLSLDWAQAVARLQQLRNQGCTLVRLREDERGRVVVEPED